MSYISENDVCNMLSVTLQDSFTVLWQSVRWQVLYSGGLYSGGSVSEYLSVALQYLSLYCGGQYAGDCCTLEVALVNAVSRVTVLVRCTLAVSTLVDAVI